MWLISLSRSSYNTKMNLVSTEVVERSLRIVSPQGRSKNCYTKKLYSNKCYSNKQQCVPFVNATAVVSEVAFVLYRITNLISARASEATLRGGGAQQNARGHDLKSAPIGRPSCHFATDDRDSLELTELWGPPNGIWL